MKCEVNESMTRLNLLANMQPVVLDKVSMENTRIIVLSAMEFNAKFSVLDVAVDRKLIALLEITSKVRDFFLEKNPIIGNRRSLKTNPPNFAAKHLIGKKELAPYFAADNTKYAPAAVALAIVTLFLITKSGRDAENFQLPIDPENTPTPELDVNQLLHMRQNILNK